MQIWREDNFIRLQDLWTNPYKSRLTESFENFGLPNPIPKTNLLKTVYRVESPKWIFRKPYTKLNPKINFLITVGIWESKTQDLDRFGLVFSTSMYYRFVRICQDLSDSLDLLDSSNLLKIVWTNWIHEPNLLKTFRIRIRNS